MPRAERAMLMAVGAAVLGMVGCTENQISQCNRLIEVANRAVTDVQAVTRSATPQDVEAMQTIADTADRASAEMQAIELRDEQLKSYQTRFVTMYSETSRATRALIAAVNQQDGAAAETAYSALQSATSQEGALVTEVNTYCGGTQQQ